MVERCGDEVGRARQSRGAARRGAGRARAGRPRQGHAGALREDPRPRAHGSSSSSPSRSARTAPGLVPVVDEPLGAPDGVRRGPRLRGPRPRRRHDATTRPSRSSRTAGHPVIRLPAQGPARHRRRVLPVGAGDGDRGRRARRESRSTSPTSRAAKERTSRAPLRAGGRCAACRSGPSPRRKTAVALLAQSNAPADLASAEGLAAHLAQAEPGDYVAHPQAYLPPTAETVSRSCRRSACLCATGCASRRRSASGRDYLHATGQLHKGGPTNGLFIQITGEDKDDLTIPGAGYGFSTLKAAQAQGDLETLRDGGAPGHPPPPHRQAAQGLQQLLQIARTATRQALTSESPDGKPVRGRILRPGHLRRLRGPDASRKLVPALWSMFQSRVLPEPFAVVGVGAHRDDNEQFRARMREAITDFARVQPPSTRVWDRFAQALFYYAGDPADAAMYPGLDAYVRGVEQRARHRRQPALLRRRRRPSLYPHLVTQARRGGPQPRAGRAARAGCASSSRSRSAATSPRRGRSTRSWPRRAARTRSTGSTTTSARRRSRTSSCSASPTASSSRCGTGITSTTCRSRSARRIGVEARGAYYEESGALRDMIQNHILQLLCLVAMEPPVTFDADPGARREDQGHARDPTHPGRRRGPRRRARPVRPRLRRRPAACAAIARSRASRRESITETYAALRARPSTTGGGRACRSTCAPASACPSARARSRCSSSARRTSSSGAIPSILAEPNLLVLRIQPDEGMSLSLRRQAARAASCGSSPVEMDFDYGQAFGGEPPEAYERLLLDAMKGDATLYARGDWVDAGVGAALTRARRAGRTGDRASSRPTRRAPGARTRPTRSSSAAGDAGGAPERAPPPWRRNYGLSCADACPHHPRRRHLDPGVVPALVDQDLERAAGLLVHLRGALVGRGRRREVPPAVGLERRAEREPTGCPARCGPCRRAGRLHRAATR